MTAIEKTGEISIAAVRASIRFVSKVPEADFRSIIVNGDLRPRLCENYLYKTKVVNAILISIRFDLEVGDSDWLFAYQNE